MFNKKMSYLQESIKAVKNIIFFGGAGVSTESGIPDFRGVNGIFKKTPEEILSYSFFKRNPKEFFSFYRENLLITDIEPNITHKYLMKLEQLRNITIITQNIDGLHQKAGSKNILELHGSIYRNYCMKCFKEYSIDFILNTELIPKCSCSGIIRPDVVLYEEELDPKVLQYSIRSLLEADLCIVAGTSLKVYPAAGLVRYFKNKEKLFVINKEKLFLDIPENNMFNTSLREVFSNMSNLDE